MTLPNDLLVALARLHAALPEQRKPDLVDLLEQLTKRLEHYAETGEGGEIEIVIQLVRGLWFEATIGGRVRVRRR